MQLSVHPISLANRQCEYYHGLTHKQMIALKQFEGSLAPRLNRDQWSCLGVIFAAKGWDAPWTPKF